MPFLLSLRLLRKSYIKNTVNQAIVTKDKNLAAQGAKFARTSWTTDYQRGARAYESNMLTFYQGTENTASCLRQTVFFYERYVTSVPADSAAKASTAARAFRLWQATAQLISREQLPSNGQTKLLDPRVTRIIKTTIASGPPPSFIPELNNAAWAICQTGTHNREYLLRATLWGKRAAELDPAAYSFDTSVHLLYRLQFYQEAEAQQQKAIAHARQEKLPAKVYEQDLEKMKRHHL